MKKYCPICRARYGAEIQLCPADGMRLFSLEDPLIGRIVDGRYRVLERIGQGGMGSVYKVRLEPTDRVEAMKVLSTRLAADPVQRARFIREARAAKRIDHEHIIKVREIGEGEEGLVYMVMEYLSGPTLSDVIARGPMPADRAVNIMIQVASGLARAHDLGVVHRDVKPDNVMLEPHENEPDFVKILDFGLARMIGDARLTTTGQVFGTPEYVSPEQATGGVATPRSDLYSCGVMLYEMLTGQLPFDGPAAQVMLGHLSREPIRPSLIRASVPRDVEEVTLKLMSKAPEDRFQDAHHLIEALSRLSVAGEDATRTVRDLSVLAGQRVVQARDTTPSGVDAWVARVVRYRERVRRIPERYYPPWLAEALERLERLAEDGRRANETLWNIAEGRFREDEELRERRRRLGRAIDVIAGDKSRLERDIQIAEKQIEALALALAAARARRRETGNDIAAKLKALRQKTRQDNAALEDLRFQLDQLRGRMAALSAGFEHESGTTGVRMRDEGLRLEAIVAEMAPLSARVEKFLTGFPGENAS